MTTCMDIDDIDNFNDFLSRDDLQDVEFLSGAIAKPEPSNASLLCYGAFCDIRAKLTKVEGLGIAVSPWVQFHEFRLVEKDKNFYLDRATDDSNSKEIGILSMAASKALVTLDSFQGIIFAAVLTSQAVSKVLKKSGPKTFTVDISINIMGPEALFASVGETLAVNQQYLQHPEYLREGMTYINPHYFYRSGCPSDLRYLVGPSMQKDTSSLTHQNLNKLLERHASGTQVMADYSWAIDTIVAKGLVRSTLKSHQKEGVSLILGREDADRASRQAQSLDSIIDGESPDKPLDLALGGIYADEMGLGKTLTMLTAIVCSNHIDSQLCEPTFEDSGLQPLKATLVVVTSPQLLNVWDYEISKHMGPNVLHVGIFHGEKRAKTL
ncbi:SNF2 superfamily RAD5 protein [Seiridium cupressi]